MCDGITHDWKEEYYGYRCQDPKCNLFIAYGCEPWAPIEDDDHEEPHGWQCTCETCIQDHPERMIYLDDYDPDDLEGDEDDQR